MSETTALDDLAVRLGTEPGQLASLAGLPDHRIRVLDDTIASAMREQDASLQDALTIALRFVPRPLRGVAKNILFGGEPDA